MFLFNAFWLVLHVGKLFETVHDLLFGSYKT